MTVRQATKLDAHGIANVSVTTWRQAYSHILPAEVLDGLDVDRKATKVAEVIEAGVPYWVAVIEDKVVGFVTVGPNNEPDIPADAELKAIYVLPERHSNGIGRALMVEAVRRARAEGFKTMCVFAFFENHSARSFYTGLGARVYDTNTYNLAGVDYPDQSYLWESLDELWIRLTS